MTNKVKYKSHCLAKKSRKHRLKSKKCSCIWRTYLLKTPSDGNNISIRLEGRIPLPLHSIFCYRCGRKGHYGDDCEKRSSCADGTDFGSAFSGKNLRHNLKKQYYRSLKRSRKDTILDSNPSDDVILAKNTKSQIYKDLIKNRNSTTVTSKRHIILNFYPPPYNNKTFKNHDNLP
ncbi:TRAMP complex RNA-binding subunit NDAI_0A03070 [Naumovozyma dairenensis CBS 421]|uniref:CCHC-type domain-containing protein n=1 Tax=Naumovozyma dairenensis (strain ATCC 10597 / BCRC 20456 / CBS 421 / NBRC 0211 / NRRL Y-12639) TaxID=1071378 RepID=G0W3S6_NAUDC|nr:hypothetical protein NDAI_0A03070 [Naumovozyma dairenensis CBS 421]CCD22464.1 hypothetical protein NDAI_0A03070 [Naumovozyma dairenensis CBS 421]